MEAVEVHAGSTHVRVLIVDDNRDAADSLAMLLRFHQYDVRIANDGFTAVEEFARDHAEVVLLDIGLPRLNGFEVCRRIRETGTPTRVLAMSGYGQEQDRSRAASVGFDAYLVKPVRLSDVLEFLQANELHSE